MLKPLALSMRMWRAIAKSRRDLCRLDCRGLDDIGIGPRDVIRGAGWTGRPFKHHPSWDHEIRSPQYAAPRLSH